MCKIHICSYVYIYLVEQKIKEGTDKSKLMIEVKMTVIIPESYRCVRGRQGEVVGKGGGGGERGGGGGSATKRDTLSFRLKGRWVRGVKWVLVVVVGGLRGLTGARVGPRI